MSLIPILIIISLLKDGKKKDILQYRAITGYLLVLLCVIIYRFTILTSPFPSDIPFIDNPIAYEKMTRVLTALTILTYYLYLIIFPLKFSVDYSYPQIPIQQDIWNISVILPLAIIILSIYIVMNKRLAKEIRLGTAFFFFPYLIISNIVIPIGTIMSERLMYLPSLGFCIIIAYIINRIIKAKKILPLINIIITLLSLYFSFRIIERNYDWKDEYSLFTADIHTSPNSAKLNNNLAYQMAIRNYKLEEALNMVNYSLTILPDYTDAIDTKGWILHKMGNDKDALLYLEEAERQAPNSADIRDHLNIVRGIVNNIN